MTSFFKIKYQQYHNSLESMTLTKHTALNENRKFSRRVSHHTDYLKDISTFYKRKA